MVAMRCWLSVLLLLPLADALQCHLPLAAAAKRRATPLLSGAADPLKRAPEEVFSVQDLVAASRARSKAEGRKGCCYKSTDYLTQDAAPASSRWAREPRVSAQPAVDGRGDGPAEESPPTPAAAKPSLLSKISLDGAVAYRASESRPRDGQPAPKYCKFDAVRDSLAAARARRAPGQQPWRPS